MSIIKYFTLQKIVAHDFRYDPRILSGCNAGNLFCVTESVKSVVDGILAFPVPENSEVQSRAVR